MKRVRLLGLCMVLLVLTMPVSFAATINAVAYGNDEINEIARETDDITIVAEVGGFADPNTNNVYLSEITGRTSFDECVDGICTLTLPSERLISPKDYTIEFIAGSERRETTASIVPDRVGARIDSITGPTTPVSPDADIQLNIKASDSSCVQTACIDRCSGIKSIDIFQGSNKVHTIDVYASECSIDLTQSVPVNALTTQDGIHTFNIKVNDIFDNTPANTKSLSLQVDNTAPYLPQTPFFLQQNGVDIVGYKEPISVLFGFNIQEPFTAIEADLSELNPSLSSVTSFTCDQFVCTKTINFQTTQSEGERTFSVDITLTDNLGNEETYTLEKEIIVDTTGPTFRRVASGNPTLDSAVVLGPQKNITIEVEDRGVGISKGNIYLDLRSLSATPQLRAQSCTENTCIFKGISSTSDGVKSIPASTSSQDDLGNTLAEPFSFSAYVDATPPRIIDVPFAGFTSTSRSFESFSPQEQQEIEQFSSGVIGRSGSSSSSGAVTGDVAEALGVPTKGDTYTVQVELEEYTNVFAYADFSAYTDEAFTIGTCEGGRDVRSWKETTPDGESHTVRTKKDDTSFITCEFEVDVTKSGTIIAQEAQLYLMDPAGNVQSTTIDLPTVYGLIDDADANYWTSSITCSPSALDRNIGPLIKQQAYCQIELEPASPTQSILNINIRSCSDSEGLLHEAYLGNGQSAHPYLQLTFREDTYEMDEIIVTCDLSITSKIGEYELTSTPETETVNVTIPLFNNPIGTPDDAVMQEIETIKEKYAEGMFKTIGTINTFLKLAQGLCRISSVFTKVTSASALVARNIPNPVGAGVRSGETYALQASTAQKGAFQKFCNFANCRATKESHGATVETAGGLAPWNDKLFSALDLGGITEDYLGCLGGDCREGDPSTYLDVKNNYILSVATLCIPGIIHNMEKYRQIQCWYGHCLQDIAVEAGLPPTACESQKSYMSCKYFVTPMFTAFPLVAFVDNVVNNIKNILKDPFVAFGFILNKYCASLSAEPEAWSTCHIVDIVNVATDAFADVQSMIQSFKGEGGNDYCKDLTNSRRSSSSSSSSRGLVSR